MSRLIDADMLKEAVEDYYRPGKIAFACDVFKDLIDEQPTVDVSGLSVYEDDLK